MTKPEDRNARAEDSFWDDGAESIIREEPETKPVYDLRNGLRDLAKLLSILQKRFTKTR